MMRSSRSSNNLNLPPPQAHTAVQRRSKPRRTTIPAPDNSGSRLIRIRNVGSTIISRYRARVFTSNSPLPKRHRNGSFAHLAPPSLRTAATSSNLEPVETGSLALIVNSLGRDLLLVEQVLNRGDALAGVKEKSCLYASPKQEVALELDNPCE
jgi:hypothetical protein